MTIQKMTTLNQLDQLYALELVCGLDPYTPEMLEDRIRNLDTFACMQGDHVLGFLTVAYNQRYQNRSLYIVNLNVSPAHRRRGIATALLHHACVSYCCFPDHCPVTLDVGRSNPVRHLYEALGFQETSTPSDNGPTDIVMATTLDQLWNQSQRKGATP